MQRRKFISILSLTPFADAFQLLGNWSMVKQSDKALVLVADNSMINYLTSAFHSAKDPVMPFNMVQLGHGESWSKAFPSAIQIAVEAPKDYTAFTSLEEVALFSKGNGRWEDLRKHTNKRIHHQGVYPETALGGQLSQIARYLNGNTSVQVFLIHHEMDDRYRLPDEPTALSPYESVEWKAMVNSLNIFQEDLEALGLAEKVLTSVFLENKDMLISDDIYQTESNKSSSILLMGKSVKSKGFTLLRGEQSDAREVFACIWLDWMGLEQQELAHHFPGFSDNKLDLFENQC